MDDYVYGCILEFIVHAACCRYARGCYNQMWTALTRLYGGEAADTSERLKEARLLRYSDKAEFKVVFVFFFF